MSIFLKDKKLMKIYKEEGYKIRKCPSCGLLCKNKRGVPVPRCYFCGCEESFEPFVLRKKDMPVLKCFVQIMYAGSFRKKSKADWKRFATDAGVKDKKWIEREGDSLEKILHGR